MRTSTIAWIFALWPCAVTCQGVPALQAPSSAASALMATVYAPVELPNPDRAATDGEGTTKAGPALLKYRAPVPALDCNAYTRWRARARCARTFLTRTASAPRPDTHLPEPVLERRL